jgi:hypothetical protein
MSEEEEDRRCERVGVWSLVRSNVRQVDKLQCRVDHQIFCGEALLL